MRSRFARSSICNSGGFDKRDGVERSIKSGVGEVVCSGATDDSAAWVVGLLTGQVQTPSSNVPMMTIFSRSWIVRRLFVQYMCKRELVIEEVWSTNIEVVYNYNFAYA